MCVWGTALYIYQIYMLVNYAHEEIQKIIHMLLTLHIIEENLESQVI